MVSYDLALVLVNGLWKLELLLLVASPDCSRRWEEAVLVADTAANRDDDDETAEVGRVCRVQLRMAEPADAGTGRILRSGE